MKPRFSGWIPALGLALASLALAPRLEAQTIPTPESVLGYTPGADFHLASYDDALAYFKTLDAASDELQLEHVGKTSGGQDWYIAIISSAENLKSVDRYKDIAKRIALVKGLDDQQAHALARDGKVIVHIDGGLHATEVAGAQHTIQLAYDLVSSQDPHVRFILDHVILVLWFSMNPDGQNMVAGWYRRNLGTPFEVAPLPWLYLKYIGHDNNRDGYMNNAHESQVVTREAVDEWYPMVFYNHHQTAPFPARIWIPPFAEPVSTNMSPLMWRWTNVFGTAMAAWLDDHGMPGSIHRGRFDDWYPGFIDNVNNYRNTISFLTETALYQYATPHFYTVGDFPKEFQGLRKEVFYASPWEGGWWRLGDAVRYMEGASMSVLDTAAKYREQIIYNRYQAGRDAIRTYAASPPYAYVIPQQQRDPQEAALLVQKMQLNGIQVSQASTTLSAGGRDYPAGTWVILMDQPYARLVKELFSIQDYPDLRETPGGSPDLPYDVAGWTLPLQMGVDAIAVIEPLPDGVRAAMRPVETIAPPPGGVSGTGTTFVIDRRPNVAATAVNRALKAGGTVSVAGQAITVDGERYAPGAFVVTGLARDRMQAIAADLALSVRATARVAEATAKLGAGRVGVYQSWQANIDAGWTLWLLEQYEFPVTEIHNDAIRAGRLKDRFDTIVIAEMSARTIMDGYAAGIVPGEFTGGIEPDGLDNLKAFVRDGGTILALGGASTFVIDAFDLPVKNVVAGLKDEEFFCAGSILKTQVQSAENPLVFGLPDEPAAFFARSGAFETGRGFEGSVLLTYPKDENPLLSGFILHPEKIEGKIASLEARRGKGRIVITGFRPQWRGQTHGMYKLIFNALYVGGGQAPASSGQAAPAGDLGRQWSDLVAGVTGELEKIFAQNQTFASARGARSAEEGKKFDGLVDQFRTTQLEKLDEFARAAGPRAPGQKIDEYTAQLKAALVDMRGKDYASTNYTLGDLRIQYRLAVLEREIGEAVGK